MESVSDIIEAFDAFIILDENTTRVFNLTECDVCGRECMAVNSLKLVKEPVFMGALNSLLVAGGMAEYHVAPSEISWCEKADCAVCDSCWEEDD